MKKENESPVSVSEKTADELNHEAEDSQKKLGEAIENELQEESEKAIDASSFPIILSKVNEGEGENGDVLEHVETLITSDSPPSKAVKVDWLQQIDDLCEKNIQENLRNASKTELLEITKELEQKNFYLLKENEVYEFILEDETVQSTLDRPDIDEDLSAQEMFLTYPTKCYFAKKKLEHAEKDLELKKDGYMKEIQNLNFELESLNISLRDLKESKEKFDKNIRIGGRHPVTKKIILQKVAKYFNDSIRTKMAFANRYKIQIQSDLMEHSKILSQIKAQEKRLASLDITEFQEAQFEHQKTCRQLAMYKEQLGKLKIKFSPLLQSIAEMKKALEKEQNEMEQMKSTVLKLEHLKAVMVSEKSRTTQKVSELKTAMRKIKLDPRRHNLPEVIDYAAAKRENGILQKNISKWKKKVEVAQQEKLLYLNALSKTEKY